MLAGLQMWGAPAAVAALPAAAVRGSAPTSLSPRSTASWPADAPPGAVASRRLAETSPPSVQHRSTGHRQGFLAELVSVIGLVAIAVVLAFVFARYRRPPREPRR